MKFAVALTLAFAGFVAASPIVRRDTIAHCGKGTGGDIDVDHILSQVENAPTKSTGGHSYPHQFYNYEKIPLSSDCDGASMMLELPIFADGHPYNLQHGEQPGAVRAIYSADNNALCAVVAHNNNNGDFHLCSTN